VLAKTITNYGDVFSDRRAVADPTVEVAARLYNRKSEDVAQMTRTIGRVLLKFTTTVAAGPVAVTPSADGRSVWGSGASFDPTISKTGTGVYVATYATTYPDALVGTTSDSVSETETVDFRFCGWNIEGSSPAVCLVTPLNNVLTIRVVDMAGAPTDLAGAGIIHVWAS